MNFFIKKKTPFCGVILYLFFLVYHQLLSLIVVIIRNTNLTIIHESHITTSQMAAFLSTLIHDLTFESSQAAVSIWKPHRKQKTRAITPSNHSIRFIVVLIIVKAFGSSFPHSSLVQTQTTQIHRQVHAENHDS